MPAFTKTKPSSHIGFLHPGLFFLLFLTGVVLANLRYADEVFWLGYQIENACLLLDTQHRTWQEFFFWVLQNRLLLWSILCVSGFFHRGNFLLLLFTGWTSASLGFFSVVLIRQFGFAGLLLGAAILLPQGLAYLPAYVLLVKNKVKRNPAYLVKALLLSGFFSSGQWANISSIRGF